MHTEPRERAQGRCVAIGSGRQREKVRANGASVGETYAGMKPVPFGFGIDGGEDEPVCFGTDQSERSAIENRLVLNGRKPASPSLPLQPLDREMRQKDGNDPLHHSTPGSNFALSCPGNARA
jgi:hypothetical protein